MEYFLRKFYVRYRKSYEMSYQFCDLHSGMKTSIQERISEQRLEEYVTITGDVNPLHVDENYAKKNGFLGKIVHGSLIEGIMSQIVGVHLPGENSLLLSLEAKFKKPLYLNEIFTVTGEITDILEAANCVKMAFIVVSDVSSETLSTGSALVKVRN